MSGPVNTVILVGNSGNNPEVRTGQDYLFLRVAYTAISASQYTTNTDVCVPMCDKMCPNIRGGAWVTPPSHDIYTQSLPEFRI